MLIPSRICSIILFFLFNILIHILIPRLASTIPIIALKPVKDHHFLTSGQLRMQDRMVFDTSFSLAAFLAFFGIWLWITDRMIILQFVNRINWSLISPIAIAHRLSAYIDFTALVRIVITPFLDTSRRSSPRPMGRVSYPVSSVPRVRPPWARLRGGPAMRVGGSTRRTGNLPIELAEIV